MDDETPDIKRIEIAASLNRAAAEALRLEIFWLARRSGIEVRDVSIRRVEQHDDASDGRPMKG